MHQWSNVLGYTTSLDKVKFNSETNFWVQDDDVNNINSVCTFGLSGLKGWSLKSPWSLPDLSFKLQKFAAAKWDFSEVHHPL